MSGKLVCSLFAVVALLSLAGACAATYVKVLEPVQQTISPGDSAPLDLGTVGPGQKVELVIDNDTGSPSKGGLTVSTSDANWDSLQVDPASLPTGWTGQDSGAYEVPLKAYVIIDPNATDGVYNFNIEAVNNYGDVPPLEFNAQATVSRQVFSMQVTSDPVKVDLGQGATYSLQLSNTGNANDVFEVTASGITGVAPVSMQVFVPKQESVTQQVTVYPSEPGAYPMVFYAQSLSSPQINSTDTTTLFAGSNLLTDSEAAARGLLLFPSAETYVYAIWAAIGSLVH